MLLVNTKNGLKYICFTGTIFLIMTCYQLHATFFGSKRCPGGNTQAPPQTVQTVHLNEGRTPFCTVCSQKINKQTNTVSRSSSSQTMLEGVCGCFMPCNVFLAGNSEVSLVLQCFTAELITYIVCECDAPECSVQQFSFFSFLTALDPQFGASV